MSVGAVLEQIRAERCGDPLYAELMGTYEQLGVLLLERPVNVAECGELVFRLIVLGVALERESDAAWAVWLARQAP